MRSIDNNICFLAVDSVHLKILVPFVAAGAIIGKGGETISQIQKQYGASIKMSKSRDYYPGEYEIVFVMNIHLIVNTNSVDLHVRPKSRV